MIFNEKGGRKAFLRMPTNMSNIKCPRCKNSNFKPTTKTHTIKTCHIEKPELTFENLPVNECIICGHTIVPKTSEVYIELIRKKIRKEMEDLVQSSQDIELTTLEKIKNAIKRLIG